MDKTNFSARRRVWSAVMRCLMVLCAALTCALAAFLIIYVLVKGVPNLSWALLRTKPSYLEGTIGILPDIISTVCMVLTTLLIVLPVGVCAAVYLTEYAGNRKLVAVIEYAAETLSGIPSIKFWECEGWGEIGLFLIPVVSAGLQAASMLCWGRRWSQRCQMRPAARYR